MCEELRADLCQIKNEQKETQNQVYLLEATIRKLREDNFEAEMVQVELKSERDLALEQAKNAQVNILKWFRSEYWGISEMGNCPESSHMYFEIK